MDDFSVDFDCVRRSGHTGTWCAGMAALRLGGNDSVTCFLLGGTVFKGEIPGLTMVVGKA